MNRSCQGPGEGGMAVTGKSKNKGAEVEQAGAFWEQQRC